MGFIDTTKSQFKQTTIQNYGFPPRCHTVHCIINKLKTNIGQSDVNLSLLVPTLFKNPLGAWWVYCLPCSVGGLLASYLLSYFLFPSRWEKISQRQSNRQPLHSEMGTSPLSPSSLGSSQTYIVSRYTYLTRGAVQNHFKCSPCKVLQNKYNFYRIEGLHLDIAMSTRVWVEGDWTNIAFRNPC
jgi:hypothetical protein